MREKNGNYTPWADQKPAATPSHMRPGIIAPQAATRQMSPSMAARLSLAREDRRPDRVE